MFALKHNSFLKIYLPLCISKLLKMRASFIRYIHRVLLTLKTFLSSKRGKLNTQNTHVHSPQEFYFQVLEMAKVLKEF